MSDSAKIRLFVDADLTGGSTFDLRTDQAHYLGGVMRRKSGDAIRVFNGRDGEWRATIDDISRKRATVVVAEQLREQSPSSTVRLLLAPIKKARFDFAIEKAVELGVGRVSPVFTANTDSGRVNAERLRAVACEAAEQCGRLDVPVVDDAIPLETALTAWPPGALLLHADETGAGRALSMVLAEIDAGAPHAFLIGPEGGFSIGELEILNGLPFSVGVGLGPRVLRAETAVCAAMAVYQAFHGDVPR